jgi:hypothetical protein
MYYCRKKKLGSLITASIPNSNRVRDNLYQGVQKQQLYRVRNYDLLCALEKITVQQISAFSSLDHCQLWMVFHRMATEKFSKSAKLQALMIQLSRWLFERKNHGSTKEYAFEEQNKGWKQVQQVILVKVRP